MNFKELAEWQKAVGACRPGLDLNGMSAVSAALERAGTGRWEVSLGGRGLHSAGLRYFGAAGTDYKAWQDAAARAFGLSRKSLPAAPHPDYPWLGAAWDLKTGAWTSLRFGGAEPKSGRALAFDFKPGDAGPARRALKPVAFKPGIFKEEALDRALEDFSRLCPVESISFEDSGWTLRLGRALRWPLFARCEVSAAFTPDSSQLALFLLDRNVVELSFDGEALWAHCAG